MIVHISNPSLDIRPLQQPSNQVFFNEHLNINIKQCFWYEPSLKKHFQALALKFSWRHLAAFSDNMRYNQSSDTDWAALQRNGIGNILFLSNDAQPKLLNQSIQCSYVKIFIVMMIVCTYKPIHHSYKIILERLLGFLFKKGYKYK